MDLEPRRSQGGAGHGGPAATRTERLLASWQRSREYGVSREAVEPVFTGSVDDSSLFASCGREVLRQLHATLVDEPVSLVLTDADGLVLDRLSGDRGLLRALDAVHLAPGFAFSERTAGTNGLALALADRAPTVVRQDEHYAVVLETYTCAAVPVLDPLTGHLQGAVNLTTRSRVPGGLLLALAQSAAGTTSALMLARSRGRQPRPTPRGEVFRVENEPGSGTLSALSSAWTGPLQEAAQALTAGRVVLAVGEPGAGRATLLAQAQRRARPQSRILSASAPAPGDVEDWLALWAPELGKPHTSVVVRGVDGLPAWAAERLADLVRGAGTPFAVTAERLEDVPAALARLVGTVVQVPPLRERPGDVVPLAEHVARRVRGRPLDLTPAAARVLEDCRWPGNTSQLVAAVRDAAARTDTVDVRHLPPEVRSDPGRRLTRLEVLERDEIARVLAEPGLPVGEAAAQLGLSRATLYRRITHYGLAHRPHEARPDSSARSTRPV